MLINLSTYEGYASSVAEAMTSGVPVIAARGSSMEEIAESAAIYVDDDNRDELIGAVRSLLDDEEMRSDMIKVGRRLASRFPRGGGGIQPTQLLSSCWRRCARLAEW